MPAGAQSRAAATRQRLLDAAVDLFIDHGYGAIGLTDITGRANVTTGAFYYHFATKEALALAVVEQGWPKVLAELTRCLNRPSPGLENVIIMTFEVCELMRRDKAVWIANNLCQTVGHLAGGRRESFTAQANGFIDRVADALSTTELRSGITAREVGSLVWIALHGCHLLSQTLQDDVADRLVLSWQVLLASVVTPQSLPYFTEFTARTARQYPVAAS